MRKNPIRVLVVDDSAVMRKLLCHVLEADPGIVVAGTAADAFEARKLLLTLNPDVMTLDIEMPRMDGLAFLDCVMSHHPTPTVVIAANAPDSSLKCQAAYARGAAAVIDKRGLRAQEPACPHAALIRQEVKAAAGRLPHQAAPPPPARGPGQDMASPDYDPRFILAIGSSTGGPEAVRSVLRALPPTLPPTVIVQHMPATFTPHFAARLNQSSSLRVKEAEDGDELRAGLVLLAPGDFHMEVVKGRGDSFRVSLHQAPPMHGVRPAVDVLMASVALAAGSRSLGLIMTGMGKDGAQGLLRMKEAGAWTIAQDQATSVVYGMPKAAVEIGAAQEILPLGRIAEVLAVRLPRKSRKSA